MKIRNSKILLPVTTNIRPGTQLLRVHPNKGPAKLKEDGDIMMDEVRNR